MSKKRVTHSPAFKAKVALAAVVGLAGYFLYSSGLMGGAIDWLKEQFGALYSFVSETFQGICDAIMAGDLGLAFEVATAAVRLVWLKTTNWLLDNKTRVYLSPEFSPIVVAAGTPVVFVQGVPTNGTEKMVVAIHNTSKYPPISSPTIQVAVATDKLSSTFTLTAGTGGSGMRTYIEGLEKSESTGKVLAYAYPLEIAAVTLPGSTYYGEPQRVISIAKFANNFAMGSEVINVSHKGGTQAEPVAFAEATNVTLSLPSAIPSSHRSYYSIAYSLDGQNGSYQQSGMTCRVPVKQFADTNREIFARLRYKGVDLAAKNIGRYMLKVEP